MTYVALLILTAMLLMYVWEVVVTDVTLNVAQAVVDASRCERLFDQIENDCIDVYSVCNKSDFDLPFIDVGITPPTGWWFDIWWYDFLAHTIILQHFYRHNPETE